MSKSNEWGMTLIEVLISLVLFALGGLGLASMLMLSNKANNSSYAKQQAIQCVYDIFDRMRANSAAAISGNYISSNLNTSGNPMPPTQPGVLCNTSACTPSQLAAYDVWYWLTNDVAKLPGGSGSITSAPTGASGNTLITVTVQWNDSLAQNLLGASSTSSANPNFAQIRIQSQL